MKKCLWCDKEFEPKRSDGKFCSTKCRVAAYQCNEKAQIKRLTKRFKGQELEAKKAILAVKHFDNVCQCCGKTGSTVVWHKDHDHLTGNFRGIICQQCNHALGCVGDDPEVLRKLINYLYRH